MRKPKGLPNRALDDSKKYSPNNDERARSVFNALCDFAWKQGQDPSVELDTIIYDFLANLGHLCDRKRIDLQNCLRMAAWHYQAETQGKGPQFS